MPLGHSPANQVSVNTVAEAILEAQVATWGTYPTVAGTTSYTHNRNGHSYSFTGTINQVVSTFNSACLDNASWFKSTKKWYGHSTTHNRDAAWNGTTIGEMLQRAVFTDYLLAKQDVVCTAGDYVGAAGGSITFNESGSYDPDAVSWNANGTYSQIYGVHSQGLQYMYWDVNGDVPNGGNWDFGAYDTSITLSVSQLMAAGCPTDQWFPYYTAAWDNEGKASAGEGWMYLYSSGGMLMSAVPEPGTMTLLLTALGVAFFLKRRRRA